jgi:hypothetical protein
MEVTVIKTNKGHKSILCEGFRYRLDVETKLGYFNMIYFDFISENIIRYDEMKFAQMS